MQLAPFVISIPETFTIVELLEDHGTSLSNEDLGLLTRAAHVAITHHKSQYRLTGEPYYEHTLSVSEIVWQMSGGVEEQCAARMHDVLEDCNPRDRSKLEEELKKHFSSRVIQLVLALTKTEGVDYWEQLQRTGSQDPWVILIKIADRLHNLRTIRGFTLEKQQSYLGVTRDELLVVCKSVLEVAKAETDKLEAAIGILEEAIERGLARVNLERGKH